MSLGSCLDPTASLEPPPLAQALLTLTATQMLQQFRDGLSMTTPFVNKIIGDCFFRFFFLFGQRHRWTGGRQTSRRKAVSNKRNRKGQVEEEIYSFYSLSCVVCLGEYLYPRPLQRILRRQMGYLLLHFYTSTTI